MRELGCDACAGAAPEVALGAAGGEERAAVLAHVEGCDRCAATLRAMTEVGDALAGLGLPVAPPPGFTGRALHRVGAGAAPPATGSRRPTSLARRVRGRPWLAVGAVAAGVGVLAGVLVGVAAGPRAPVPATRIATAALEAPGGPVGQVVVVSGPHPWLAVTLDMAAAPARVTCEVRSTSGARVDVGAFAVAGGYAYWAAPLPDRFAVASTALVGRRGDVLATALLGGGAAAQSSPSR